MTDQQKLEQLLRSQKHMVLAVTLDDGTPWTLPVAIRSRNGLTTFEWDSVLETEHSKALNKRPEMAMTVFQKREDAQIGFYAKGRGELLEEVKPGLGRYRFTAEQAWINDETFVKRSVNLV